MRRLLAVLALALLVPAVGNAAVRLGPDVTKPMPSGGLHLAAMGCQQLAQYNPCAFFNAYSTNADVVAGSPIDGVITSWSFRAGCCDGETDVPHHLKLYTYKLTSGPYLSAAPVSEGATFEIPPGNVLLSDPPTKLPARLPIATGELVAISADHPIAFAIDDTIPGVTYTFLANGYTYGSFYTAGALMISALVEPDADKDGFGDETQDCAPADAAVHEGCVPTSPPVVLPPPPDPLSVGCNAPVCAGTTNGSGGTSTPTAPVPVPKTGTIAPPTNPNSVYVPLSCPPNVPQYCGGYLSVIAGGAKASAAATATRTRYSIAPGKSKQVKVPLSAKLRQQLKRKGKLTVTLRLQPDGGAKATTFTRTIKLKHKPAAKPKR
ncbi:hypothetical protein [Baekduia sp. Peel2402]|uniref:hypothetical protein n=1 Tax=Baekduia sp. Peel2402 TaxID=3458296 RepID=UPI00403ECA69